jgi:DNA-binding NarL/FixJ family response regulator
MKTIRILVADPVELIADGLRARLTDVPDMEVVGYVGTGQALLQRLGELEVDVVLLEVSLPGMDGIDATRELHKRFPQIKVLAHSALTEIEYVNSMLVEGASGYLAKSAPVAEIVQAVRSSLEGIQHLSETVRQSLEAGYKFTDKRPGGDYVGLTEREREVIRMIALEKTNDEIATALFVSAETVKTHRKNLMIKLNVRSAAGLVKYAVDRRWV